MLGDLDHQLARCQPEVAYIVQHGLDTPFADLVDEGVTADIDKQPTGVAEGTPAIEGHDDGVHLELVQQILFARLTQHGVGRLKCRSARTTNQRLMTEDGAIAQIGNRLEHRVEPTFTHQSGQRPGALDDLWRQGSDRMPGDRLQVVVLHRTLLDCCSDAVRRNAMDGMQRDLQR